MVASKDCLHTQLMRYPGLDHLAKNKKGKMNDRLNE